MSSDIVECPYCGVDTAIYCEEPDQDSQHESECSKCGKSFVYTVSISVTYRSEKADCLNGSPHNFEQTHTAPYCASRMRCTMCGAEKLIAIDKLCPKRDRCKTYCIYLDKNPEVVGERAQ